MNYQELLDTLFSFKDEKYAEFTKPLTNSDYICIGVRLPITKDLAKKHYLDEDLLLDDFKLSKYLEVDEIYFMIALLRIKDINKQLDFVLKNTKYVLSWSVTDTIPQYLKKLDFDSFYSFFLKTYESKYIYTRRVGYVIAMKFRQDKRVLSLLPYIRENEDYMVMMGEAWLLATIAISFPQEILEFTRNLKDLTLKRKIISKISDSYRISEEMKKEFKALR